MFKSKLIKVYRYFKATIQAIKLYFRYFNVRQIVAPPHYIFHVSPSEIRWLTNCEDKLDEDIRNRNFAMETFRGTFVGGNWDIHQHKFEELAVFKAIQQRMTEGTSWETTAFYTECMRDINQGRVLWKCKTSEQLLKRFSFIDNIILDMKINGYKTGYDSCIAGEDSSTLAKNRKYSDEITINIGRDGDYLFQDGRHRLAIAKILEVPSVPVKILVRHNYWYEKLNMMKSGKLPLVDCKHPDYIYLFETDKKL